jgi:hypothetical protein
VSIGADYDPPKLASGTSAFESVPESSKSCNDAAVAGAYSTFGFSGGERNYTVQTLESSHPIEDDTITTIPEPSSLALCAIGFAGLMVVRRSPRPRCS